MDLHSADALARALMAEHGLDRTGWAFAFDDATRRMGSCRFGEEMLITLSRHYAQCADEAQVRDTVLHEIAHALTPRDKHGTRWKAVALRLGATPRACGENPFANSAGEVAKRLAAVAGKPFVLVNHPDGAGRRYRILRESARSYGLVDEQGEEVRVQRGLVYPEGGTPKTRAEILTEQLEQNVRDVAGRPVMEVNHRSYRGRRFSILRKVRHGTAVKLVDLDTGRIVTSPRSLVREVDDTAIEVRTAAS